MQDSIEKLPDWLGAFVSRLDTKEIKNLAKTIAKELAISQRNRVSSQKNPDGSAFLPRKNIKKTKQHGRIRDAMFNKLMNAKWLKAKSNNSTASLEFVGRVQRIAKVHQFGLKDKVRRGGDYEYKYPHRELIGITEEELHKIQKTVTNHILGI